MYRCVDTVLYAAIVFISHTDVVWAEHLDKTAASTPRTCMFLLEEQERAGRQFGSTCSNCAKTRLRSSRGRFRAVGHVAGLPRSDAQWGGVMDSTFVVVAARPPGRTAHLPAKPSPLAREYVN